LDAAGEAAKELREKLAGVPKAPMHAQDQAAMEQLEEDAQALEEAIAGADVRRAVELARKLAEGAAGLSKELGESESRESDEARSEGLKDGMGKLGEG